MGVVGVFDPTDVQGSVLTITMVEDIIIIFYFCRLQTQKSKGLNI